MIVKVRFDCNLIIEFYKAMSLFVEGQIMIMLIQLQLNITLKVPKGLKNLSFNLRFLSLQNIFNKEIIMKGLLNHFYLYFFSHIRVI